ncbi:MAG: T9SS type A sorting domain-containing protein [candidate division WOR-3 bacterium]
MKKFLIFIVIGWGLCQDTLWTRRYDNGLDEAGYSVATDNDGNIIVAGVTVDAMGGTVPGNCLIVKYSPNGNLLWTKEYDAGGDDWLIDAAVDRGNNIIVAGYTFDTTSYFAQALIIKYSPSGDTIWSRRYQSVFFDIAQGVTTDSMNNIYVSGLSFNGNTYDLILLKYSSNGDLVWDRIYDNGFDEIGYRADVSSDQSVTVCGIVYPPSYEADFLLIKYLPNGDTLWTKVYNFNVDDICTDIAIDFGDNICLTGATGAYPAYDILTVKCNPNGDTVWSRIFDYGGDDEALGIAINSNNDIFVTGVSEGNLYDYLTLRYTESGYLKWEGRFDTGNDDQGLGIAVDNSDNIIVSGASYNGTNYDFLIVKYHPDVGISEYVKQRKSAPKIFPNPASDKIYLQTSKRKGTIEIKIYDVCGRCVKAKKFEEKNDLLSIPISDLAPGTYFMEIRTQSQKTMNKFVIMR